MHCCRTHFLRCADYSRFISIEIAGSVNAGPREQGEIVNTPIAAGQSRNVLQLIARRFCFLRERTHRGAEVFQGPGEVTLRCGIASELLLCGG